MTKIRESADAGGFGGGERGIRLLNGGDDRAQLGGLRLAELDDSVRIHVLIMTSPSDIESQRGAPVENPQKLIYMRVHDGSTRSSIEQKYEYWIPASSVRELPWREGTLTDIRREPIEFVGDIEACDCLLDPLRSAHVALTTACAPSPRASLVQRPASTSSTAWTAASNL